MEKTGFVAPTSKPIVVSAPGAVPLDPLEAEIARPERGRPVQIHVYDPPLAVPGESVQGPRGYSL